MTMLTESVKVALVQLPNSNNMSILLALDQASKTTGYAVYENNTLIGWDKFSYDDDDVGVRLTKIRNKVISLIKDYQVTEVAIEDIQMQNSIGNNVVTYRTLAEVRGVLEELFTEMKIPYTIVSSNTWKSALKIKGTKSAEQKRAAQAYVLNKYSIKAIQDTCDAICIGDYMISKQDDGFDWSE